MAFAQKSISQRNSYKDRRAFNRVHVAKTTQIKHWTSKAIGISQIKLRIKAAVRIFYIILKEIECNLLDKSLKSFSHQIHCKHKACNRQITFLHQYFHQIFYILNPFTATVSYTRLTTTKTDSIFFTKTMHRELQKD